MSTNTGLLIASSNFKVLSVKINNISIRNNYINDLSIDWNTSFRIFGYFTLNDHYDAINTMFINPGMSMVIEFTDNYDARFSRHFNILSSTEDKEQDFKTIVFRFQDNISWLLQNTFIAKSYKKTTIIDVFNDFYALEAKKTAEIDKITVLSQKTPELSNFVVPLHIDFLTFMENEFRREGIFFYQTRKEIVMSNNRKVPETPEFPYTQVGSKDLYGFNILEYKLQFNDIKYTSVLQKNNTLVFDKSTKSMTSYDKCLKDFMNDFNTGGIVKNSQMTIGTQLKTKEVLIDTQKYNHYIFRNNTQMFIIVPGNIDFSLLWKTVEVKLSGAVYTIETRKSGDVALSGKYQISRVEDKFIAGQKFIQRLTLIRVNQGKPV